MAGGTIVPRKPRSSPDLRGTAGQASRDVSASGGYVFIRGSTLNLGTGRVTAIGGTGNGLGATAGISTKSGDGYIVVKGKTVTGTTTPTAHVL